MRPVLSAQQARSTILVALDTIRGVLGSANMQHHGLMGLFVLEFMCTCVVHVHDVGVCVCVHRILTMSVSRMTKDSDAVLSATICFLFHLLFPNSLLQSHTPPIPLLPCLFSFLSIPLRYPLIDSLCIGGQTGPAHLSPSTHLSDNILDIRGGRLVGPGIGERHRQRGII